MNETPLAIEIPGLKKRYLVEQLIWNLRGWIDCSVDLPSWDQMVVFCFVGRYTD
jgi:hypothetical protein